MKVSTDACIQGAWSAAQLQGLQPATILDIGAGTGLLTLMLAQRLTASRFLAIEPEPGACAQAAENFRSSPWPERIRCEGTDLQGLIGQHRNGKNFEAIICNPPFFEGQLGAGSAPRNLARHDALSMAELAGSAWRLLRPGGILSVLYPEREWARWERTAAQAGWELRRELKIVPAPGKAANRRIGLFSEAAGTRCVTVREELIIYEAPGRYSPAFVQLLQPYYLYL